MVIGLGRFGKSLALELVAQGTEVLGIDSDGNDLEASILSASVVLGLGVENV